jgi:GntR family transcriptional regulator
VPVDPERAEPLYRQLAGELRAGIYAGTYPRGGRLPTEAELAAGHQVSRVTVRLALGLLHDEGLTETVRGRGTFVRATAPVRLAFSRYAGQGEVGPFTAAARAQGVDGQMTLVDVKRLAAPPEVAARLELEDGAPVVRRVRHALIDGEPVQLQTSWFSAALVVGTPLARSRFLKAGTFATLRAIGRPPARISEELTAGLPTAEEAEILGSAPVLRVTRVTRGQDGAALELLYVTAAGDRFAFTYDDLPIEGADHA